MEGCPGCSAWQKEETYLVKGADGGQEYYRGGYIGTLVRWLHTQKEDDISGALSAKAAAVEQGSQCRVGDRETGIGRPTGRGAPQASGGGGEKGGDVGPADAEELPISGSQARTAALAARTNGKQKAKEQNEAHRRQRTAPTRVAAPKLSVSTQSVRPSQSPRVKGNPETLACPRCPVLPD